MKFYWFNKKCCVPECLSCSTMGDGCYKEYFDLPAEPRSRARWLKSILSEDGEDLKVCEDHFRENDIFLDKNNRKKLRLNSMPSVKLPKYICNVCLGSKKTDNNYAEQKICKCPPPQPVFQSTPKKRSRLSWSKEEKKTLFKVIKRHGNIQKAQSKFLIDWDNVMKNYRNSGYFGNEKEIKSAWQNMKSRAKKVFDNEAYGSQLERKISKFLFGKGSKTKINKLERPDQATSSGTAYIEELSSDDEFTEEPSRLTKLDESRALKVDTEENIERDEDAVENVLRDKNSKTFDDENGEGRNADAENETFSESEDEYYSIEDVEKKLGITIEPKRPEVISLISSDESDFD